MSKFINTNHKVTIDALVDGIKDKLKNPYYLFNDKKACIVDYYNQNTTKSTLDEGMKQPYALIGTNSPLKFNLIKDAYLYGIDRIAIDQNIGEFGLEADSIEGEAIVLPNTFIPIANDYFRIKHVSQDVMFKVINVSIDTLEDGANIYKIQYKLDRYDDQRIDDQVADTFRMIVNNVGTNYKAVIRSNDYELIEILDNTLISLKKYYKDLFFSNKVQTFIFMMDNERFYDPYMIEFLIRNKLLVGDGEYLFVTQQVTLPQTFTIDYDKSFFRSVEIGDKTNINRRIESIANGISDMNSMMSPSIRTDTYYMIDYAKVDNSQFTSKIKNIDVDLLNRIESNTPYNKDDPRSMWNILIHYFNKDNFNAEWVKEIDNVDLSMTKDVFYAIPMIIYCVEYYIKLLIK